MLANDGSDDKIVLFRLLRIYIYHLAEAESLFIDGTFSICPLIFYQVFSIHIMKQGQTFPMVYAHDDPLFRLYICMFVTLLI